MRIVACLAGALVAGSSLGSPVSPGSLSAVTTQRSIGIEWQVTGDANYTAIGTVRYRVQGSAEWREGFDLMRVDFSGTNTVAGSVMFLEPATDYELEVTLLDSDGGGTQQTIDVATRSDPVKPAGGQVLHVSSGAQGGDGTPASPFGSLSAAQSAAQPGDTVLVHAGSYSGVSFNRSGDADNYLVVQAAGDGEVTIYGAQVSADNVWIEGLTFRDQSNGLTTSGSPQNVVVRRNVFLDNHYGIRMNGGGYGWTITDNVIAGDNVYEQGSFSGEGIELNHTSGHTVAYNRISNTGDGISYPESDVDIYGNDIFDMSDDGIEGDYGRANIRVWGNRLQNTLHNGFSFQDQEGGPWYLVRNVLINYDEAALKYRITDRHVLVHNTFINWGQVIDDWGQNVLNAYSRNNLFVSAGGGLMFRMINPGFGYPSIFINWRTDVDYDGFDWAGFDLPFEYHGTQYAGLAGVQADLGLWPNGREVDAVQCLPELGLVTGPTPVRVPPMHARLQSPCAAIDAGVAIVNLAEDYLGTAPDLGAYEYGAALPVFGPRPQVPDSDNDSVPDDVDNCTLVANPVQVDADSDGIGNACDADITNDCLVNFADLAALKAAFFPAAYNPVADFNADGVVNFADLAFMKSTFFTSTSPGPGPSAPGSCASLKLISTPDLRGHPGIFVVESANALEVDHLTLFW